MHFPPSVQLGSVYAIALSLTCGVHHSPIKSIGITFSAARLDVPEQTTAAMLQKAESKWRMFFPNIRHNSQRTMSEKPVGLIVPSA